MKKKKIGIIFGGDSPEYGVSLESAYSVISNMKKEKYELVLIGITKNGDWYKYEGDIENIKNDTWNQNGKCSKVLISTNKSDTGLLEIEENRINLIKLDAIFPIMHGKNGEDGTIQGLIELSGIPLIGCNVLSSSLCMDKYVSHQLVAYNGIKVAKSVVITSNTNSKDIEEKLATLKYPLFVKPMRAGSSFGITKVEDKDQIEEAIKEAFKYDTEIIIEENVEGIEIGCSILGNKELIVGEVDEIELSEGFFNFTEKYTLKSSKIHVPARIEREVAQKAKETAKQIYKILKCKDFARVDMFLTKENEIYFNEINTIPGFTSHSRYPNMMKHANIEFDELLDRIVSLEI